MPNASLVAGQIPLENADWEEINVFAHTFDGYAESGSFERCAVIAHQRLHDTLSELRTCLFFEARSWRHRGDEPGNGDLAYLRGLVRQIREKVTKGELA